MTKAWGGRFGPEGGRGAEAFTATLPVDQRLWPQDLAGSRAHARMLARQGILSEAELETILTGLDAVEAEIRSGQAVFDPALEDIHLWVESRLTERVGPVGGKLHTGRSRNDQVALDEHLFVVEAAGELDLALRGLQTALLERAEREARLIMPGYTHLQRAQPVLWSFHLLAFAFMFERDRDRLRETRRRATCSPLGAAALAGTPHPIDAHWTARELGLEAPCPNALDATSDRDGIVDLLYAGSMVAVHLSRLADELVLFSTEEFGFVVLDEAYARGSSIMPQKRNPETAELIRGKSGRVIGNLVALLVTLKGLPLGYQSDLMEDKARLFDTVDTVKASLTVMTQVVETLTVRPERMAQAATGFALVTDLADALATRGLPFREAHHRVGMLVRRMEAEGIGVEDLTPQVLSRLDPTIPAELLAVLDPARAVAARRSAGGTAPERVAEQIASLRRSLAGEAAGG